MKILYLAFIIFLSLKTAVAGLFDDRYPSARALGMGGAVVAVTNDVWASYYNPAGLAAVNNYQVASSYNLPFGYTFFRNYFLSATAKLPENYGSVGVSFQDFGVNYLGNEMSTEYTVGISHGFYLMKDIHSSLSFGYNLKLYHWNLAQSVGSWDASIGEYLNDGLDLGSTSTLGMDVGAQASLYGRTFVGVYLVNINSPSVGKNTKHDLPQRIVIGAAYKPQNGVTTSLAFNKAVGYETQVEGGFELQIIEYLTLRLGVGTNPNRFSAGLGIIFEGIQFDYALRTHPVLSETHLFGLSYTWE
jgi:hypothetical protein